MVPKWSVRFSIMLVASVLVGIIAVDASVADIQTQSFKTIDYDAGSVIEGEFMFLRTAKSVIQSSASGSILYGKVPDTINPGPRERGALDVVLIVTQDVPTESIGYKLLEGGISSLAIVPFVIFGGVIGALLAIKFRNEPMGFMVFILPGLLVGYLAGDFVMDPMRNDDMNIVIDNASDHGVSIKIDQYPPISLPAKSQIGIGIEEGAKQFVIEETGGARRRESYVLSAVRSKDTRGRSSFDGYVVNVFSANKYRVQEGAYRTK